MVYHQPQRDYQFSFSFFLLLSSLVSLWTGRLTPRPLWSLCRLPPGWTRWPPSSRHRRSPHIPLRAPGRVSPWLHRYSPRESLRCKYHNIQPFIPHYRTCLPHTAQGCTPAQGLPSTHWNILYQAHRDISPWVLSSPPCWASCGRSW